ncbi:MAG: acylphosphatase [Rhodocyclaceae bacterium]|nr:acylphosphatase [Rhodocyclaceae bacterium]
MTCRVRMQVIGRVQGVFFRQSTADHARLLGLCGWVANEDDGSVKIDAQGPKEKLESLVIWCRKGPSNARVDDLLVEWLDELDPAYSRFEILR